MREARCSNCGCTGHRSRICPEPKTSYGLLLISRDHGVPEVEAVDGSALDVTDSASMRRLAYCRDHLRFCLVSRRVSLGFIELISGRYDPLDIGGLQVIFRQLYPSERPLIAAGDYSACLKHFLDHGSDKSAKSDRYSNFYRRAEIKFRVLLHCKPYGLQYYLDTTASDYVGPEWGIPKGRRAHPEESDIGVAMREFEEETGYKQYQILRIPPVIEDMTGTNGVKYRHVYYYALDIGPGMNNDTDDPLEIGDVRMFSYDEAISQLRPYHERKKQILTGAFLLYYTGDWNQCVRPIGTTRKMLAV